MAQRTLSKSDFKIARTCDAKLFFRENHYPDSSEDDPYLGMLKVGGYMVEALATARKPGVIDLEYGGDYEAAFQKTLEYLKRDRVTLGQATLIWNRRLARVDIIEKDGDVIRLIEVKSGSFDGAEHARNLAAGGVGVFRSTRKPHGVKCEWREYFEDVTYQTIMLEHLFPNARIEPRLILVDTSKRSTVDNIPRLFEIVRRIGSDGVERLHTARFSGDPKLLASIDLLTEVDVSAEVDMLREDVEDEAQRYEAMLDASFELFHVDLGSKCRDCEYKGDVEPEGFDKCWGDLADVEPHVLELYQVSKAKDREDTPVVERLVDEGKASLFDVPFEWLVKKDGTVGAIAERQRIQIRSTENHEPWIGSGLRERIESVEYPLHFIDFEVSRLALPYHAGMKPYGQVVFQWSCHTVDSPGAPPRHSEWLNTAEVWPNKTFALALREAIGDAGSVLTWTKFERSTLNEITRELEQFGEPDPALAAWIAEIGTRRLVDLNEWTLKEFFHPGMGGRTSIKVVLDALWKADPTMREQFVAWTGLDASEATDPYHALPALVINGVAQDVREGTGAVRAYEAMMYGVEKNDDAAKRAWAGLLLQYCRLDTLSMILIFEYWRRATGLATIPSYTPVVGHPSGMSS